MPAIEVTDLRKSYGPREALHGIELVVEHGEVFALLGPNGAGKTTTVEILEGYRTRDGGAVRVLGEDPGSAGRRFRSRIGIVLQSSAVYPNLTVEELTRLFAGYYPSPREVGEVSFLGRSLFRTRLAFPANVPPGSYQVEVFQLQNGSIVSAQSSPLGIAKIGLEAELFEFARRQAALYGLAAIILAIAAGWSANIMFGRR